jgi:hypothetical protein
MSAYSGPEIPNDGLIFSIDVANQKCISPSAARGFNNAPQLVKNLISPSDSITSTDTLRLGNLSYYTAFSIDYPESSFGGDAVSRQGITPGFNVRSGTKTYDASRSLHLWVWNNETNAWVADSFFRGERLAGHCYDSYVGTAPVDLWVADYNIIKNTFKDITVIASGSHRDSFHTAAQYEILRDLGAPSNVDSIIGFSSPEWVLVGKPGLGSGNGAWAFQNYSTNPDQVAHMNFAIPIFGNTQNYLNFDGTNQKAVTPIQSFGNNTTWEAWIYPTANISTINMFMGRFLPYFGFYGGNSLFFSNNIGGSQRTIQTATNLPLNTWYHATFTTTFDGTNTTMRIYTNGVETASGVFAGAQGNYGTSYNFTIGDGYQSNWYQYQGRISKVGIYNRALSATEVQQNFNALRSRFGL